MSTVVTDEIALKNIAANVSRLMDVRGLTQQQLADLTGETQVSISRIKRGANMPGVGVLKRIAEALDTSMDVLTMDPPEHVVKNSRRAS